MTHGGIGYDENFFLWGGWCITKGLRPYADFIEFKPPFTFLTHALALKLFGFDGFRYRLFFVYFHLLALGAAQLALLSRGADKVLSTLFLIGYVALFANTRFHDTALTDTESIGLAYYLLGAACLFARTRFRKTFDVLGGAFFIACCQSKEPLVPVAFATWVACFFARQRTRSLKDEAMAYAKYTALGALLVVAGLCIYMVPTGAMKQYLLMVKGYFTFYRDPNKSYCVLLGRFHPTTRWHDLEIQWDQARREYFNTDTLGYLFPFAAGTFAFTLRRNFPLFVAALLSAIFGLYAVTASNCQWIHYYNMTTAGLFIFWAVGVDAISVAMKGSSRLTRIFVQLTVAGVVLFPIWSRFDAERAFLGTRQFGTPYVEPIPGLFRIIAENTTPADRISPPGRPTSTSRSNYWHAVYGNALAYAELLYATGMLTPDAAEELQ